MLVQTTVGRHVLLLCLSCLLMLNCCYQKIAAYAADSCTCSAAGGARWGEGVGGIARSCCARWCC